MRTTKIADLYRKIDQQNQCWGMLGVEIKDLLKKDLRALEYTPPWGILWRTAGEFVVKDPHSVNFMQRKFLRHHLKTMLEILGYGIRETDEYTEVVPLEEVDFD